jgi:hypothetical protein
MRAAVIFLTILCAVWLSGPPHETRSQSAFVDTGDTNSDGIVDLTDAVLILHYLFLGSTAPARIPIAEAENNDALEARVAALETLLAGVTRESLPDGQGGDVDTIQFSGVNVRVVNGTGKTGQSPNGLGNLTIGYNRAPTDREANRTGSHNLVVGDQNNYSSWGSLITGTRNTSAARFANVLGGKDTTADQEWGALDMDALERIRGGFLLNSFQPWTPTDSYAMTILAKDVWIQAGTNQQTGETEPGFLSAILRACVSLKGTGAESAYDCVRLVSYEDIGQIGLIEGNQLRIQKLSEAVFPDG